MNREILFRGKRIDSGEWVQGDLVHSKSGFAFIKDPSNCEYGLWENGHYCGNHFVDKIDPSTVGQLAGKPDMEGKQAFEGDIIVPNDYKPEEATGIIKFGGNRSDISGENHQEAGFWVEWQGDYSQCLCNDAGYWLPISRIVGNIHDGKDGQDDEL